MYFPQSSWSCIPGLVGRKGLGWLAAAGTTHQSPGISTSRRWKMWPSGKMYPYQKTMMLLCLMFVNLAQTGLNISDCLMAWGKWPRLVWTIWVRSRNCSCLVTWFCYQLIAKPGNKTATAPWPDPYGPWCRLSPKRLLKLITHSLGASGNAILASAFW